MKLPWKINSTHRSLIIGSNQKPKRHCDEQKVGSCGGRRSNLNFSTTCVSKKIASSAIPQKSSRFLAMT